MKQQLMLAALLFCGIRTLCLGAGQTEAGIAANQAEFGGEDARIVVSIQSSIYTYEVRNLSDRPIVGFEVAQHAAYNFHAPEGWQIDTSSDSFRAWPDPSTAGIAPGQTAEFSMRVSSKGAVLGRASAKLKLRSGQTIEVPDVWAPAPEPAGYFALVAGMILLIALLHSAVIIHRKRRTKKTPVSA